MFDPSRIPPISLKNITLSGEISFARACVALSPLILTICFSSVNPIGARTGTPPLDIISLILFELVSIILPTKPNSSSSMTHLKTSSINGTADTFLFIKADVIF